MGININRGRAFVVGKRLTQGAIGLGLLYGAASCVTSAREERKAEEAKVAHFQDVRDKFVNRLHLLSRIRSDGQVFVLTGPHTVETSEGGIKHVMNFKTRMIAIDGPGNADRLIGFDDMKSPALVRTAHHAACQVSRADVRQYSELRYTFGNARLNQQKDAIIASRVTFQAAHCRPGQTI